jgi:hypothetical protein
MGQNGSRQSGANSSEQLKPSYGVLLAAYAQRFERQSPNSIKKRFDRYMQRGRLDITRTSSGEWHVGLK